MPVFLQYAVSLLAKPIMQTYYIPAHVHFAVEGDVTVFMNLRSDQYSMLLGAKARVFKRLIAGSSTSKQQAISLDIDADDATPSALTYEVVSELCTSGLLTTDCRTSTPWSLAPRRLPEETFVGIDPAPRVSIGVKELRAFLVSCIVAKWRLSFGRIEGTVRAVERRKRLRGHGSSVDINRARALVSAYNRLRPLAPWNYWCLFDSLSLLEFLARYHCYPSWVFAVQLEPWAAHCWVQDDVVAFNETVDEARTYLPLLAI